MTDPAAPGPAARAWAEQLAAWAIPDDILAAAPRSPWAHPVSRFAQRLDESLRRAGGPSYDAAVAALADARSGGLAGSVLDVGAGVGAAGLPLLVSGPAASLTAVDANADMLAALQQRADGLGLPVTTLVGRWPDVAGEVPVHDVVVSHHVLYDVADIVPFLRALTDAARTRVVVEVPPQHPLAWMAPLWQQFHGLARPTRPMNDDLLAVLAEMGIDDVSVVSWTEPSRSMPALTGDERAERAAQITQRLCLPEGRQPEVADALDSLGDVAERRDLVTLTWRGAA